MTAGSKLGVRVSDAIDEYLDSSRSRGDRPNTLRSKRTALDRLLRDERCGNILLRTITGRHIDHVFETMHRDQLAARTVNTYRQVFTHFFTWCQTRRYIPLGATPLAGTRALKTMPRKRVTIPAARFGHLLDSAEESSKRDRVVVALGLYLFLRQSEIVSLTVGDIDLDDQRVDVTIHKTQDRDLMPVSTELDTELRSWLTFYANQVGVLKPHYPLTPAKKQPRWRGVGQGVLERTDGGVCQLNPARPLIQPHLAVQRALVRAGYPIRDDDGKRNYEGIHTLRRSGARALYESLLDRGHDSAIREVQAMLHHKSVTMTEHYLGITADLKRRDENIRGKIMFPGIVADRNVVKLHPAQGAAS